MCFLKMFLLLTLICCVPRTLALISCSKSDTFLTCTSDDDSNVLQKGLVSDDEEVQGITVKNCKISSIEPESFSNLPLLELLDLSENLLNDIPLGVLDNLNTVRTFNLSYNSLTGLNLGIFDQMTGLTQLDLSFNKMTSLDLGIFDSIPKLTSLDIRNNFIYGLPLGILDKSTELINIDLSYNDMSVLPLGVFDQSKNLQSINLEYSKFSEMPSGIFDQNTELQTLYLSGNDIVEIPDKHFASTINLKEVDLSKNAINVLLDDAFAYSLDIRKLNLSSNQLTDGTPVMSLPRLSILDLSKNQMQDIPAINLPSLVYLDISSNRLTNLGNQIGMNIPKKLKSFILHRNPWQCSCLEQLLGVLRRRNVNYKSPDFFDGKKPVCAVIQDKASRCFKDGSRDSEFYNIYTAGLKKYETVKG